MELASFGRPVFPEGAVWGSATQDGWVLTQDGLHKRYYVSIDRGFNSNKKKLHPSRMENVFRLETFRWKMLLHLGWLEKKWNSAVDQLFKVKKAHTRLDNNLIEWLPSEITSIRSAIFSFVEKPVEIVNENIGDRLQRINRSFRFYNDWIRSVEYVIEQMLISNISPTVNATRIKMVVNTREYIFERKVWNRAWALLFWPEPNTREIVLGKGD